MKLEQVANIVAETLNDLSALFVNGTELTFLMRNPKQKDSHMIVSNDNLLEVAELIKASANGTPEGHDQFTTNLSNADALIH